jgi:ribosomal-protein-alanine N-acetyltransferase
MNEFLNDKPPELQARIRWMIRRDMPRVLAIEQAAFIDPWCENNLCLILEQSHAIGMVADIDEQIVGFMIYEMHQGCIYIANLTVQPELKRQSIGTQMINKLKAKLHSRRNRILIDVNRHNAEVRGFLGACGFRVAETPEDMPTPFYQAVLNRDGSQNALPLAHDPERLLLEFVMSAPTAATPLPAFLTAGDYTAKC